MKAKIAIVYVSTHHGNTKKVVEAMSEERACDLYPADRAKDVDFSEYDVVGFASGVYFQSLSPAIIQLAKDIELDARQRTFIVYTAGIDFKNYAASVERILREKAGTYVGRYACRGYDTWGPFGLFGGIGRKHPTDKELLKAREFIKALHGSAD